MNLEIKNPYEFSAEVRQLETTDRGHPDSFNPQFKTLINNDVYLKNKLESVMILSLSAGGWSNSAPYTQVVAWEKVKEADAPIIGMYIGDGLTAEQVKAQNKAYGCVDRAVATDGMITFYCYNKKPASDFKVSIKGV